MFNRLLLRLHPLLDEKKELPLVELVTNTVEPVDKLRQSQDYNLVMRYGKFSWNLDIGNSKKIARRYINATRLQEMALGYYTQ